MIQPSIPALHRLLLTALAAAAAGAQACAASGGTLLQFDFNNGNPWLQTTGSGAGAKVEARNVGTIDIPGGKDPSGGLRLPVSGAARKVGWLAAWTSGALAVQNAETHLGKLTLSFSLSASAAQPVKVRVDSFDAQRHRNGGLETLIHPAAPDFYQRYALDLSNMTPAGEGAFDPAAPFVAFTWEINNTMGWPLGADNELRLDNVHYAKPAFYVSPQGSDASDGLTEQMPLATPQRAIELAVAGDIVLVMNGTFLSNREIVSFPRPGKPSAWITLKNFPGHQPVFKSTAWQAIRIGRGNPGRPVSQPALAYLEVRGLRVRGTASEVPTHYAADIGKSRPTSNGNGISADGRYEIQKPHHLRFAENTVFECSGAGISVIQADWATVESNHVHGNCQWMIYAGSGISIYQACNFEATKGGYRMLIRHNRTHDNRCTQPWIATGKISDGNGIIIDDFQNTQNHSQNGAYEGRTLVQGNLSYRNGGSGMHAYVSHHVDFIHNTAWMNSVSPELQYAQIFAQDCADVRILNNILVAPVADLSAGERPETINGAGGSTNVVYANNLYFGGNKPPLTGEGDRIADPLFINASTNPAVANFHLKAGSPALKVGRREAFSPLLDLDGKRLPLREPPDLGAYQR